MAAKTAAIWLARPFESRLIDVLIESGFNAQE